jgi:Rieske [2Fe-2S] domain
VVQVIRADVGKFYMVPCIYVATPQKPSSWRIDNFIPIIGPKHEDGEALNFPHQHYHIDWRFVPQAMFENCSDYIGKPHGHVVSNTHGNHVVEGEPVLKLRKCRREMPDFPAAPIGRSSGTTRSWAGLEVVQTFVCNKLKPGNICPHRGIDLTPFVKPDGTVICPGHGLRWDTNTGDLLPHHRSHA